MTDLPVSTIDYPGEIASVVYTVGCNLRCPYCQNVSLLDTNDSIPWKDVIKKITDKSDVLTGVVFTGGEPTIHSELPCAIEHVKSLGLKVKLDTNGTNPDMVRKLIDDKLIDYLAVDVKCLADDWDTFIPNGYVPYPDYKALLGYAMGKVNAEARTTMHSRVVIGHDIPEMRELIPTGCKWYLQRYRDCDPPPPDEALLHTNEYTVDDLKRFAASVGASVRGE